MCSSLSPYRAWKLSCHKYCCPSLQDNLSCSSTEVTACQKFCDTEFLVLFLQNKGLIDHLPVGGLVIRLVWPWNVWSSSWGVKMLECVRKRQWYCWSDIPEERCAIKSKVGSLDPGVVKCMCFHLRWGEILEEPFTMWLWYKGEREGLASNEVLSPTRPLL